MALIALALFWTLNGGGNHVPNVLRHFFPKNWIKIVILGPYKSYLMVVKNEQTQKLPHGADVQNGGGVRATFGQCPEERGFLPNSRFPLTSQSIWKSGEALYLGGCRGRRGRRCLYAELGTRTNMSATEVE